MEFDKAMEQAAEFLTFSPRFMDPKAPQGLWICDSLAEVSAIELNAVTLATGGDWDDFLRCKPFLEAFPYLVLVTPNAIARSVMVDKLRPRLPGFCLYVIQDSGFRGCRTIGEYVDKYGRADLLSILEGAEELPAYGLLNLARVEYRDMSKVPRTVSRFKGLDQGIGGFFAGELSLWSGKAGVGKSTLLGQLLLEAVDQGHCVCAYSGELDKDQFRDWIYLQAAGPRHVAYRSDPVTGKKVAHADALADRQISEWLGDRFWLFDLEVNTRHSPEGILSQFDYARMRYGADVFLVDNVMTVDFRETRERDFYRAQSDFGLNLAAWAKRHSAHVHLVVHPQKQVPDSIKEISLEHISGTSDLTRASNNVFFLGTHTAEDRRGGLVEKPILKILKNRRYGAKGTQWLDFDKRSRRYFVDRTGDPERCYGWVPMSQQMTVTEDRADIDQVFPAEQ